MKEIRYFGPHREPAVLVERFEELREGAVVWVSPCSCGRQIRQMLHRKFSQFTTGPCWAPLPEHTCSGFTKYHVVSAFTVAAGRVFAVVLDPPADAQSTKRTRSLEDA